MSLERGEMNRQKQKKYNSSSEPLSYMILAFIFGFLFIVLIPPFQVPDEPNHFLRAYQITQGDFIAEKRVKAGYGPVAGGEIPVSLVKTIRKVIDRIPHNPQRKQNIADVIAAFSFPLKRGEKNFFSFPNTAMYSPVPYIPQAVGIAIGKVFDFSPLMLLYLGRFCNLLFVLITVTLAIRIMPVSRTIIFLLALMPMTMHQSASLSSDALIIALAFLFTAMVIRAVIDSDFYPGAGYLISLIFIAILLSLSKSVYVLIVLLYFAIPIDKSKTPVRYWIIGAMAVILSLGSCFLWTHAASSLYVPLRKGMPHSLDVFMQYIASHPFDYSLLMIKTFFHDLPVLMWWFVGSLGWLDTPLHISFIVLYWVVLLFAAVTEETPGKALSLQRKGLFFLVIGGCTALMLTSLFLTWTSPGAPFIVGLQGRYFIPLSPIFFLLFSGLGSGRIKSGGKWRHFGAVGFVLCSLSYTAVVIVRRYYVE